MVINRRPTFVYQFRGRANNNIIACNKFALATTVAVIVRYNCHSSCYDFMKAIYRRIALPLTTQFAMVATNHSVLSSNEMRSVEIRPDEVG